MLALFGLTMCRLAARSDTADAVALATAIATSQLATDAAVPAASPGEHRYDPPGEGYRATG
jgi:hypothetical protein